MTLTTQYQYLGRSAPLKSQSGSGSYYLLLYGAAAADDTAAAYRVSLKLRLASANGNSFYGFPTSGNGFVEGLPALSWSWSSLPAAEWNSATLTAGDISYAAWTELGEGAVTVTTGYGLERTVQLQGSFTFCQGAESWLPKIQQPVTVTASATLAALTGATQPRVSVTSTPISKEVTVYTDAPAGFTHTLRYRFGDATGIIGENVTGSIVWKAPLALCSQIPNSVTGTAVIYCDTFNAAGFVGTKQTTLQMKVPTTILPTVSADWEDPSGAYTALGTLAQNLSALRLQTTAEGVYGSTVTATSVTLGGKAYAGGVITDAGDLTLEITVTDSRGRTGKYREVLSVAAYRLPSLKLTASRCTEDGTADEGGSYARITVTGSVSNVGSDNNWQLKVNWGAGNETRTGSPGSLSYSKIAPADADQTVTVTAALSDRVKTVQRTMTLSIGYATLDLLAGGKGIALGKAASREGFDCAMPAYFSGGISVVTGTYEGDFQTAPEGTWWTKPSGGKCSNYPEGATYGFLSTTVSGNQRLLRYVQHSDGSQYTCNNVNGWKDWVRMDGIQPKLNLNTVYKTKEYHKGKQVYRKLISFGALPATGEKNISTGIAFSDYEIVDYAMGLQHSTGEYVYFMTPMLTFGFYKKAVSGKDYWHATAEVQGDLSAYTGTVEIRYVEKG